MSKTSSLPSTPSLEETEGISKDEVDNNHNKRLSSFQTDGSYLDPVKSYSRKKRITFVHDLTVKDMSFPANIPGLSKSRTEKFHKLFKSVPEDEYPIDYFSCAFIGDILLQGNLYVSQNWFCFYSRIRGRGRLQEIPMNKVISITREKTALIFPNAIAFQTAEQKYSFGSFISRDNTYKFLVTMWKKSQEVQSGASRSLTGSASASQNRSSTSSTTGQEFMFSADNQDSEVDNQNYSQNNSQDTQSHSVSKTDSANQTDDDVCAECSALDPGENQTGEDNSAMSSQDKGTLTGTIIRKECRHSTKERSISHTRRKDLEHRQLGFPYSVINSIDRQKTMKALKKSASKLQRIPRTNLLLAICSIFVLFLLLSAVCLTYKILDLEAKLVAHSLWTSTSTQNFRQRTYMNMLSLQTAAQSSTAHHILTVLRANIQILEEIYHSLQGLKDDTISTDKRYCDEETSCHDNH